MKSIIFTCLILFSSVMMSQNDKQEQDIKKNEASLNVFNLLVFKCLDFSYEHYLNDESGAGISIMMSLEGEERLDKGGPYYFESFMVTGFYKFYFGQKPNSGLFSELFTSFTQGIYDDYYDDALSNYSYRREDFSQFAVGLTIGVKYRSKQGFVGSVFGGVGRNFLNTDKTPAVTPRVGITLGYGF